MRCSTGSSSTSRSEQGNALDGDHLQSPDITCRRSARTQVPTKRGAGHSLTPLPPDRVQQDTPALRHLSASVFGIGRLGSGPGAERVSCRTCILGRRACEDGAGA